MLNVVDQVKFAGQGYKNNEKLLVGNEKQKKNEGKNILWFASRMVKKKN